MILFQVTMINTLNPLPGKLGLSQRGCECFQAEETEQSSAFGAFQCLLNRIKDFLN